MFSPKSHIIRDMGQLKLMALIKTIRPARWYRNLVVFVGVFLANRMVGVEATNIIDVFVLPFVTTCMLASANYGINEIVDAQSDKHHPTKKNRPIPSGDISATPVLITSILLYVLGITYLILQGNLGLLAVSIAFILNSLFYNLKPIRLKDRPLIDFTSEALNNPLRIAIGWYALLPTANILPSSLIVSFWALGAFFMAGKRFAELRFLKDKKVAKMYRKSLEHYSVQNLLIYMILAFGTANFMAGALTIKHFHNLIFVIPFYLLWGGMYFKYAHEDNSFVKDPERVFEKRPYVLYTLLLGLLTICLLFVDTIPLAKTILGL